MLTIYKRHLTLLLLPCAAWAVSAQADNQAGLTITPSIGYFMHDKDLGLDDHIYGGLTLGYQTRSPWAVELSYIKGGTEHDIAGTDVDIEQLFVSGLYHLSEQDGVQPFLSFGGGNQSVVTPSYDVENSIFTVGGGLKASLNKSLSLRTDLRLMSDLDNELTSYAFSVGLRYLVGAPTHSVKASPLPSDTDGDGVYDSLDRCSGTATGTQVDAHGCELSSDDDRDGIANHLDRCPNTKTGAKVDDQGCYLVITETKAIHLHVVFETNSPNVSPVSYSEIEKVVQFMREYPLTDVLLEGHTDDSGSAAYNLQLSQQRAQAVANILTSQFGIEASRVAAQGFGEEQPLFKNDSVENRAKNRRVTAKVSAQVEKIQQ